MTAMVTVDTTPEASGWRCTVRVTQDGGASGHVVRVRPEDLERYGRPGETPEQLVARTFDFLLAREPAGQILRSFEVADVTRYFPEFDSEMRS
jgi:hypothetical protein